MKVWRVPYRAVMEGEADIHANTKEEAETAVEGGSFDIDYDAEMVDWKRKGPAKEMK